MQYIVQVICKIIKVRNKIKFLVRRRRKKKTYWNATTSTKQIHSQGMQAINVFLDVVVVIFIVRWLFNLRSVRVHFFQPYARISTCIIPFRTIHISCNIYRFFFVCFALVVFSSPFLPCHCFIKDEKKCLWQSSINLWLLS